MPHTATKPKMKAKEIRAKNRATNGHDKKGHRWDSPPAHPPAMKKT